MSVLIADRQIIATEIDQYLQSAEYQILAQSTQKEYARVSEHLRDELGETLLADCTRSWLRKLRARWSQKGHRAAAMKLQLLKNVLAPAMLDEIVAPYLFTGMKRITSRNPAGEPNAIWSDEEVEAVIDYAISRRQDGLARAVGLARWAGFRRGTICEITQDARVSILKATGVERRLRWDTEKTGVLADKPEDSRLTDLLDERTITCAGHLSYSAYGEPWAPRQLSQALQRVVEALAGRGIVRHGSTLHGLRHARGVELAEAGASDAMIMAQLEHKTPHSARIYRRQADRSRLADLGQQLIDSERNDR